MIQYEVLFAARGNFRQIVTLLDEDLEILDLQRGLNSGLYVTSIEEGGTFIETAKGGERVAIIESVDTDLEFNDFEVLEY